MWSSGWSKRRCQKIVRSCAGVFFFFKQKTAYDIRLSLVGSEMCIRDSYEGLYGLPDSCAPDGVQTLRQRQQRLDAKANVAGGINEQFYRNQLNALGYTTATIEQFQNLDSTPDPEWGEFWRYYWRVNIPADANVHWQTCSSTCDSAIRTWGDTVAECVIDKLAPSHTVVVFAYPEGTEDASN